MNGNKVIGITGGIASGKTLLADFIQEKYNLPVLKSDITAFMLINTDSEIQKKLIQKFSDKIFNKDGSLNKEYASEIIFGNDKSRKTEYEKIIHPAVIDHHISEIENYFNLGYENVFVESALIYEIGMEDAYDYIISVFSDEKNVIERLKKRNSLSDDEIQMRLNAQLSPNSKKDKADFVIDNNKDLKSFYTAAEFIIDLILELPPKEDEEDN